MSKPQVLLFLTCVCQLPENPPQAEYQLWQDQVKSSRQSSELIPRTVRAVAGEGWEDSRRREVSWTLKCLLNSCDQTAIVLTQGNVICCINRCMFHLLLWIMKFKSHLSGELSSRWMGQEALLIFPFGPVGAIGAGVNNQYMEHSVWKGRGWVGSVLDPVSVCFGMQGRDALKQVWNLFCIDLQHLWEVIKSY